MKDKTILITRPKYEPTTVYLYYWSRRIIDSARSKGSKVLDIAESKVTKQEFEGRVKKMNPDYVHLNGHGSSKSVTGHDYEVILDMSNADVLKGKIAYALSCDSADLLGPEAARSGATAYVGYDKEFYFATNNHSNTRPESDDHAAFFLEPAMKLSEELLKGKTVAEAINETKKAYDKSIAKAASSEAQTGYAGFVKYLLWDKMCLTGHGTVDAKI